MKIINLKYKRFFAILLMLSFLLSIGVYATEAETHEQEMIRQTIKNAHISAVSTVTISDSGETFLSFGNDIDETSLFCIGSVSKSFTGFAILYLEEIGSLTLSDSITKYIPWFEAIYEEKNVADTITIADLLYQTSGYTNSEKDYPNATGAMSLEDNAKNISGRDLTYAPSQQFSYSNANYNLLGYIIEQVTQRSYSEFMENEIFLPLGLTNTYSSSNANQSFVSGTRLSFWKAWNYTLPISQGAVPAGYILSCSQDLSLWLQIHLGTIEIDPVYRNVVEKSHIANSISVIDENSHYAAGWYVDDSDGRIYHSGGTANYSSRLVIDFQNGNAACVLTNINASANTNDMADNLINLLAGNKDMIYSQDIWTIMDNIFSTVTIISCVLLLLIIIIIKKKKQFNSLLFILPIIALLLAIACLIILPSIFNNPWNAIVIWAPLSIPIGIASLFLFSIPGSIFIKIALKRKHK